MKAICMKFIGSQKMCQQSTLQTRREKTYESQGIDRVRGSTIKNRCDVDLLNGIDLKSGDRRQFKICERLLRFPTFVVMISESGVVRSQVVTKEPLIRLSSLIVEF